MLWRHSGVARCEWQLPPSSIVKSLEGYSGAFYAQEYEKKKISGARRNLFANVISVFLICGCIGVRADLKEGAWKKNRSEVFDEKRDGNNRNRTLAKKPRARSTDHPDISRPRTVVLRTQQTHCSETAHRAGTWTCQRSKRKKEKMCRRIVTTRSVQYR